MSRGKIFTSQTAAAVGGLLSSCLGTFHPLVSQLRVFFQPVPLGTEAAVLRNHEAALAQSFLTDAPSPNWDCVTPSLLNTVRQRVQELTDLLLTHALCLSMLWARQV